MYIYICFTHQTKTEQKSELTILKYGLAYFNNEEDLVRHMPAANNAVQFGWAISPNYQP